MAKSLRTFFEIYPADPRGTRPIGTRVNDVVYANGLAGVDLVTGEPAEDVTSQMSLILEHLRSLMEQAGGDLDGVVRCAAYVTNMEDRETIYGPWEELFPDPADRPALKALLAELPEGHLVHLDVFGLIGGKRTRIDIPNVHARDPGVRVGNVHFTSRCHGNDPTTGQIVEGGRGGGGAADDGEPRDAGRAGRRQRGEHRPAQHVWAGRHLQGSRAEGLRGALPGSRRPARFCTSS